MSDWYEAVAVCDIELAESDALADSVIKRLVSEGIIQSTTDPESVLGRGVGYRPGPKIQSLYSLGEHEGAFWTL